MRWKHRHTTAAPSELPLPEFEIEPELALPLLLASNYLHL